MTLLIGGASFVAIYLILGMVIASGSPTLQGWIRSGRTDRAEHALYVLFMVIWLFLLPWFVFRGLRYFVGGISDLVTQIREARTRKPKLPTATTKLPRRWNGLCAAGQHALDFEAQPCDLCAAETRATAK
jgi:hypothetical protein